MLFVFLCDSLDSENVKLGSMKREKLPLRCKWNIPTEGKDAGIVSCKATVPAELKWEPEQRANIVQVMRFVLEELYNLDNTARYRVRVNGRIYWQKNVLIGQKIKGVKSIWLRPPAGKPYKWFALGPGKRWGWVRKLLDHRGPGDN